MPFLQCPDSSEAKTSRAAKSLPFMQRGIHHSGYVMKCELLQLSHNWRTDDGNSAETIHATNRESTPANRAAAQFAGSHRVQAAGSGQRPGQPASFRRTSWYCEIGMDSCTSRTQPAKGTG